MEMTPEEFMQELQRINNEVIHNAEIGVNEVAEDLLSVSQKLAPLKDGGLMESGNVDPAKKQGNEIVAKVGYNKVYALRRHEEFYNLGATSARKPSVDGMSVGRKYLEQPTNKYGEKYNEFIAKRIGGVFE
ncbi:HK97 gp10 family phage protein [Neobacillus mesonae]|uniref:HK97 gp10 family phage protein n=1 Tax=Neobacillus mesonae TaxID=1193713 RepID=UPI002573A000|nr:HK97 gp10 family phage protein [Neobacillus mesonae]